MAAQTLAPINNRTAAPYRLLDAWRGFAALWVVMIHACLPTIANEAPALAKAPLYAFSLWGQLGVVMFFVISGYCITAAVDSALRKPDSLSHFLRARLRRIYPPYLASSIIAVIFALFFTFLAAHHLIPKVHHPMPFLGQHFLFYFASLTLTQVPLHTQLLLPVYWSLCYEITFYALVAICLALLGRKSKTVFFSGLNVFTAVSLVWLIVSPSICPFPLNLWYQFGIGALVYMLITHPQERLFRACFVAAVFLASLFACLHPGAHSIGHPSSRIETVFCVAFAVLLLGLHRFDATLAQKRAVKVFEWLGAFSYSLYLSHFFVIPIPQQLAKRMGFQGGTYWVSFLAQIIVAIGFAYLFHIVFERPFLSPKAKVREAEIYSPQATVIDNARDEMKEKILVKAKSL